jgi:hypothetical protein
VSNEQRLQRLLALVPYLQANPGVTVVEAAADFGVSPGQVDRDLRLLWLCGLPGHGPGDLIDLAFEGDRVSVIFDAGMTRPLRLTPDEALALVVALRTLAETPGIADAGAVQRALAKVEAAAGGRVDDTTVAVALDDDQRLLPVLRRNERKYTVIFIVSSTVLFAAGMTMAYLVLTKGLTVLLSAAGTNVQALLTVDRYLSFVTLMLVVFGAAFELPLLVIMANLSGALPASWLRRSQRLAIFSIFLFAAVATPSTDPFTMSAMAVPMVVLFEAAVLFATVHDRRKAKRKAAAKAAERADSADSADSVDTVASHLDPIPAPLPPAAGSPLAQSTWADTT